MATLWLNPGGVPISGAYTLTVNGVGTTWQSVAAPSLSLSPSISGTSLGSVTVISDTQFTVPVTTGTTTGVTTLTDATSGASAKLSVGAFFRDTLSSGVTAGYDLSTHTPDLGLWTKLSRGWSGSGSDAAVFTADGWVRAGSTSGRYTFYTMGAAPGPDYFIQTDFRLEATYGLAAIGVRYDPATGSGVGIEFNGGTGYLLQFLNPTSNSYTILANFALPTAPATGNLRVEVNNNVYTVYLNGVLKITYTDSNGLVNAPGCPFLMEASAATDTTGVHFHSFHAAPTSPSKLITLTSPLSYQKAQRNLSTGNGSIPVSVTNNDTAAHPIQYQFNGGSWTTLTSSLAAGATYTGSISAPTSEGTFLVRFGDSTSTLTGSDHVGVGDVFLIIGQSNGAGHGYSNQDPYALGENTNSYLVPGKVSSTIGWSRGTDPQQTGHAGSWTPLLGAVLTNALAVPIGFVNASIDGTAISGWVPPSGTDWTAALSLASSAGAGGFRAALWDQGESDAQLGTTQSTYATALSAVAAGVRSNYGIPLMVAVLQATGLGSSAQIAVIQAAQRQCIASDPNCISGPDMSDLYVDNSPHFGSNWQLQTLALRWAGKIFAEVYGAPTTSTASKSGQRHRGR